MRVTSTRRDVVAGCTTCHGREPRWREANAQAVAARHHDSTGHQTWVTVTLEVVYGMKRDLAEDLTLKLDL